MTLLLNIDGADVETGVRFLYAGLRPDGRPPVGKDFVELLGWPATVYC